MSVGLTALAIVTMLAFFVESMTEYIFGEWMSQKAIKYTALVVGVVAAFAFNVTILKSLAGLDVNPWADTVLSGLVLGRGSSFLHDFYSTYLAPKPPA